jgi:hypothetical protein
MPHFLLDRWSLAPRPNLTAWVVLVCGLATAAAARAEEPAATAQAPAGTVQAPATTLQATPEGIEYFEKNIRPLLVRHCYECHGPKRKGGLRLDSHAELLAGGDSGPAVVPGDAAASLILQAVAHQEEPKMPPAGKLPDEEIARLTEWVKLGAPWPADTAPPAPDEPEDAWKAHWAFQPVTRPALPPVKQTSWPRNELDYFVLARLEAAGLAPSEPADRRTLVRRATYDVTGLPATTAEVEAFVNDPDPNAFDRVIERLLASPHYGERWARHWLDVARYADSKGYVFTADRSYPHAYRYRDWVVRAFNDDLPYDQFLVQQIAADRLPGDPSRLAAMGFLTVGRRFLNNTHDIIDDRLDVLIRGTMGLTVTCARCHDHKFDPIPTADYYSLYGVLASSVEPAEPADYMTLADAPQPVEPHVFVRGNPGNQGPAVPRQFLSALAGDARKPFQDGSGRLELARAIATRDNPLTARVIVNRQWLYYFNAPLVHTPSDFGLRSEPPTHPELLDYLAASLVDGGWSLKDVARRILRSAAYQQASGDRADCRAADPENRLLWRMNRKRLNFEGLRDSLLAVSGQFDDALGGPAVVITTSPAPRRRTLYGLIDRQNLPNLFRTFDFASPDTHSPQRFTTTVPQQALFMLNSPFVGEQVRALAARAEFAGAADDRARIETLYRTALGRAPSEQERALGLAFLSAEQASDQAPTPSAAPPTDLQPQATEVAAAIAPTDKPTTGGTPAAAAGPKSEEEKAAQEKAAKQAAEKAREQAQQRAAAGPPLSAWQRYVQIVLLSNEFAYVD